MPFLRFADDAAMYDSTPLDNMFIIENLPSAPEAFLKVYIYARMLCMHPEMGGMEELSRALKLDGEMIENAFSYWERAGFMRRVADNPPEYVFVPTRGSSVTEMDRDYYKYRDFNGELQQLFPAGKLIHPAQYGLANDWLNVYGFEQGAVIALVKNALANTRSKNPDPARIFKTVDKKVQELARLDITDEAGVIKAVSKDGNVDRTVREVLHSLGMFREPSEPETALVNKWLYDWKLTTEDIHKGCLETVKAHNPSFAYLDRILEGRTDKPGNASFEAMRGILRLMGLTINPSVEHRAWYEGLIKEGFEPETIELAARQQSKRRIPSINGLMDMLDTWKANNLQKYDDAFGFVTNGQRVRDEFKSILTNAGIVQPLNENDLAAYEAWRQTVPGELIQFAADNSKGRSYPLSHIFYLLDKWNGMGITDVEAARRAVSGAAGSGQTAQPKANPALNYQQRDYSDDEFDGDAFMEEARRLMQQGTEGN